MQQWAHASALFAKLPEPSTTTKKKNTTRKTIQKYFSACGAFKQTQKQRPRTPNRRLNWELGTAEAVDGGASFAFDLSALKAVDGKVLNMCKN